MINVLFFASLKETLDCESLNVEPTQAADVGALRSLLGDKGPQWSKAMGGSSTLVAVNQAMADDDTAINDGDEVAFFPPVTGG